MRSLLVPLSIALTTGCAAGQQSTVCDSIGESASVITPEQHSACAAAMMRALDILGGQVSRFVDRDDVASRDQAVQTERQLSRLLTRSGYARDTWSNERTDERWPDSRLRAFNSNVFQAHEYYRRALERLTGPEPSSWAEMGWSWERERRTRLGDARRYHAAAAALYDALW
jgi:hypothetical protein